MLRRISLSNDGKVRVKSKELPKDLPDKPKADGGVRLIRVTLDSTPRAKRSEQGVNGHWLFDEPLGRNGEFGFIYLIHDLYNDRMYIGKKQFEGRGKLNKGQPTNWPWYTSSCTKLVNSIRANGKECFRFYVLDQYTIRGTLGYAETWSLMHVEAPAYPERWYNSLVQKVSWIVKEGVSPKHKHRLSEILAGRGDKLEVYQ